MNINFANHRPFPGHEPTMPGSDPNYLAHQQPRMVNRAAGFWSRPSDHTPRSSKSRSSGCRARRTTRFLLLTVAITRAVAAAGASKGDRTRLDV
eukprot:3514071-Pleurochrysis_carterae.AAC.1